MAIQLERIPLAIKDSYVLSCFSFYSYCIKATASVGIASATASSDSLTYVSCSSKADLRSSGNSMLTLITHPSDDTDDPYYVSYMGPKNAQLILVDPTSCSETA